MMRSLQAEKVENHKGDVNMLKEVDNTKEQKTIFGGETIGDDFGTEFLKHISDWRKYV